MQPKVNFELDEPVVLHLRYAQGRIIDNPWDPHPSSYQYIFSAEEGVFYLSDTSGALLNARLRSRGVQPGQTITITKVNVPNPNSTRPIAEYFPRVCEELA